MPPAGTLVAALSLAVEPAAGDAGGAVAAAPPALDPVEHHAFAGTAAWTGWHVGYPDPRSQGPIISPKS